MEHREFLEIAKALDACEMFLDELIGSLEAFDTYNADYCMEYIGKAFGISINPSLFSTTLGGSHGV